MIIRKIEMEHFGQFHGETITFSPGINLIYGKNESGKSTIHTFIRGMLFGIDKNRGREGKNSKYTAYLPWDTPSFYSGRMDVSDKGSNYHIYRNFYKETKTDECIDILTGEKVPFKAGVPGFLPDGLNLVQYSNTISMEQGSIMSHKDLSEQLKNYIANVSSSKDQEIDIRSALKSLKEEQKKIRLSDAQEQLENAQRGMKLLENKERLLRERCSELERIKKEYEAEKKLLYRIDQNVDTSRAILRSGRKENEMDFSIPAQTQRKQKRKTVLLALAVLSVLFGLTVGKWNVIAAAGILLFAAFLFLICFLSGKTKRRSVSERENDMVTEPMPAEVLQSLLKEKSLTKERMEEIKEYISQLKEEINGLEQEITDLEPFEDKIDEYEKKVNQEKKNMEAVLLAADTITKLSEQIQYSFGSLLDCEMSEMIKDITDGKYDKVFVEEGLAVKAEMGSQIVSVDQLSKGTMEQFYFTLRLAVFHLLYPDETMPVILDDTLAYYDNERMAAILQKLAGSGQQVLLFTCHRREYDYLSQHHIPFRFISLS